MASVPRRATLLVVLVLLITAASMVGHFVTDAMCVVLDTAGVTECVVGQVADGRSSSTSTEKIDVHSTFDLPTNLSTIPSVTLTFTLTAISLAYLPFSPRPSLPPPRRLS